MKTVKYSSINSFSKQIVNRTVTTLGFFFFFYLYITTSLEISPLNGTTIYGAKNLTQPTKLLLTRLFDSPTQPEKKYMFVMSQVFLDHIKTH